MAYNWFNTQLGGLYGKQVGNSTIFAKIWRRENAYYETPEHSTFGNTKLGRVGIVLDNIHLNGERVKGAVRIKWTGQIVSNTLPESEWGVLAIMEAIRYAQQLAIKDCRENRGHRFDESDYADVPQTEVVIKLRHGMEATLDMGLVFETTGIAKLKAFVVGKEDERRCYHYGHTGCISFDQDGWHDIGKTSKATMKAIGGEAGLQAFLDEARKLTAVRTLELEARS